MRTDRIGIIALTVWMVGMGVTHAQELTPAPTTGQQVPPPVVIPVSGVLQTVSGALRTGTVTLQLSLYAAREDTAPMWVEDQLVTLGPDGAYAVHFGATRAEGLPAYLFADTGARWVGVAVAGEAEAPRTLVLSAPYASKAVTADWLGGKRATDFVLSENLRAILQSWGITGSTTGESLSSTTLDGGTIQSLGGGGPSTPNALVKWLDNQQTAGDSAVYESGGNVGIRTASPQYALSVGVSDRIGFYGDAGHNASIELYNGATAAMNFQTTNAAGGGFIFTGGNVGIGIPSPQYALALGASDRIGFYGDAGHNASIELYNGATASMHFQTTNAAGGAFTFTGGNVGIGTTAPSATLHVAGDARLTGALTAQGAAFGSDVSVTGNLTATGTIGAKWQDVAEWVEATEPLPAATVVSAHPTRVNHVRRSAKGYDTAVLGVVSTQPGLLLGEAGDGKVAVAQSGRVKVKVDARYGAIRPGDLLVTSPRAGYAMRSRPTRSGIHRPGTIIGKALEALPNGTGEILVLLTLQ